MENAHVDLNNLNPKRKVSLDSDHYDKQVADSQLKNSVSTHSLKSAKSNRKISGDHIVPLASKLRIGQSEIHIGRIAYRKPNSVSAKLSRQNSAWSDNNSIISDYSFDLPAAAGKPPKLTKFYLGEQNEHDNKSWNGDSDLDIPEDIPEEDERYLTIQKSMKSVKINANEIFNQQLPNDGNKED